jgi:hypothetical protein
VQKYRVFKLAGLFIRPKLHNSAVQRTIVTRTRRGRTTMEQNFDSFKDRP